MEDIKHLAAIKIVGDWNLESILARLHVADVNDCIYYDYCMNNQIDLYTFDNDLESLGNNEFLHIM